MSHDLQIISKKHTNLEDSCMQYIYYLQQISIGFVCAINNHLNFNIVRFLSAYIMV